MDSRLAVFVADPLLPTAQDSEGSRYMPGAALRSDLADADDWGDRLILTGTVRSTTRERVGRSVIEVWHADANGHYDPGYRFRGTLITSKTGRYTIHTIIPGRSGARPPHLHIKVRAWGYRTLTTRLYVADHAAVRYGQVLAFSLDQGVSRATFDFVLDPEPSTDVS
jgi:protocatechuate 3,4-dioxygenase beta subunit